MVRSEQIHTSLFAVAILTHAKTRLWTEILSVFGAIRQTDCFLSIGTGIDANHELSRPARTYPLSTAKSLGHIATNSELTHILFRGLINAFAPLPRTTKYWRLNVAQEIPAWDEIKRIWVFLTKEEHHHADYKPVIELDDVSGALGPLMEMTKQYLEQKEVQDAISACARALDAKQMY